MNRRRPNRAALIALIAVFAAVLAACGGGSGTSASTSSPEKTAGTTVTTAPATTKAPATTATSMTEEEATTTAAEGSCDVADLNLVTPGTLTVATGDPAFPPWVGTADGEGFDDPTSKLGFEAGLVYAIAGELGFSDDQVEWKRIGFNEAIAPGPKDWDFNLQQYSITDDRAEIVDFSVPYYTTRQSLVTYPDSKYAKAKTIDDLKDATLGAQIGTTSLDFIEKVIKPNKDPNVYDENVDLEAAMKAGQIDALVMDLPAAYYVTAVQLEGAVIAGQFEAEAAEPDNYGLLFAKDNPLVPCIDAAIETLLDNGTLQKLEDTYLAQGGGIPTITGG